MNRLRFKLFQHLTLSDDSISDEEYSLILLKFEIFTRRKEDLRVKSMMSLEN